MSFFCSTGKATSGTISCRIANCSLFAIFPHLKNTSPRSHGTRRQFSSRDDSNVNTPDINFVNALVRAGQCSNNSSPRVVQQVARVSQLRSRLPYQQIFSYTSYEHQEKVNLGTPAGEFSTKEELLALVDQYDNRSYTDHLPLPELPDLRQPEDGPHIIISDEPEDCHWPSRRCKWPARGEELKALERLEEALKDINIPPEDSYKLYRAIPAPRMPYLDANTRHKLLYNLGVVERKDEEGMLRYLSVIDDMKAVGIPLTTAQWNCATSFAGRYVGRTTDVEVESGLRSWKEMEHVAGVRGNSATFNILFDLATKAGKFNLAEKIYEEMSKRGHSFNRFHHVSLIHYYGLRADGDGVRKAYKALIEAGEIVDTVVLNCVISSLFRAYEPQAAENVYERMKRLHAGRIRAEIPPRDFRKRREVTKALMKMAKYAKRNPAQHKFFQNQSIIAPDAQTYRILVQYLAVHAGELHKAVKYLDEMRWFEVPLNGSVFLALFKGFALHGGIRYSHWTRDRLESVWRAYMQAIDSQYDGLYVGKWMIVWALKAFGKCSNSERTVEVWEGIKDKWNPQDEELELATKVLRSLIET